MLFRSHDLWLTAIYCERVVALQGGRVIGHGPTEEVLTVELIRDVFGVEVSLSDHPTLAGKKVALPYAKRHTPIEVALAEAELSRPVENPERRPSPH